jgi:hypothetical protein
MFPVYMLDGLIKITKHLFQEGRCPGINSKMAFLDFEEHTHPYRWSQLAG